MAQKWPHLEEELGSSIRTKLGSRIKSTDTAISFTHFCKEGNLENPEKYDYIFFIFSSQKKYSN